MKKIKTRVLLQMENEWKCFPFVDLLETNEGKYIQTIENDM